MTDTQARDLLTVTVAISAGVHAALAPEHWRERPALGIGFALATAALVATAAALQVAPAAGQPVAALLLAGLTALYVLSRTTGLPLTGHEEWDTVGLATQVVQAIGVALAVRPLIRTTRIRGGTYAPVTHA